MSGALAAAAIALGELVTFHLAGTADAWCARVTSLGPGPGSIPYAWLVVEASPAWVVTLPVEQLAPGCAR